MKIWIFYLKNFKAVQHILTLTVFITVFHIGRIELITSELKMLPLQLFILAICYPVTNFVLRTTEMEKAIIVEKERLGI